MKNKKIAYQFVEDLKSSTGNPPEGLLRDKERSSISSFEDVSLDDGPEEGIFVECQPFKALCDLEQDLGKEVYRHLDECRHAEMELLRGNGDSSCKGCFDVCGIGDLEKPQVCMVNRISGFFECGRGSKALASVVSMEAKCCGEVLQPDYLREVDHFLPI